MTKKEFTDFDIRQIAQSGQCFRLRPVPEAENTYSLTAGKKYLEISQQGTEITFSCTEQELESLPALGYEEAKAELLKLCGAGVKVADCICLFALHHIEAFPVDTHIKAMLRRYPSGFPFERYQGFAGVLQQYAFYYELHGQK